MLFLFSTAWQADITAISLIKSTDSNRDIRFFFIYQLRNRFRTIYETYSNIQKPDNEQLFLEMLLYDTGSVTVWWHTHPSFSNSPLQSTTGPPLPMRSRVCKLTENKQVVKVRVMTVWQSRGEQNPHIVKEQVTPGETSLPTICPRTASLSEGFSLHRSKRWSGGGGGGGRKCG